MNWKLAALAIILALGFNWYAWSTLNEASERLATAKQDQVEAAKLLDRLVSVRDKTAGLVHVLESGYDYSEDLSNAFNDAGIPFKGTLTPGIARQRNNSTVEFRTIQKPLNDASLTLIQILKFIAAVNRENKFNLKKLILVPDKNSEQENELWNATFDLFYCNKT